VRIAIATSRWLICRSPAPVPSVSGSGRASRAKLIVVPLYAIEVG
jgi:hypothetical protein